MAFTLFLQGTLIPVPPVEKALAFLAEHPEERRRAGPAPPLDRRIAGDRSAGIEALAADYRRRRSDGRDDHVRPRRPAPLVRIDRGRLRVPVNHEDGG